MAKKKEVRPEVVTSAPSALSVPSVESVESVRAKALAHAREFEALRAREGRVEQARGLLAAARTGGAAEREAARRALAGLTLAERLQLAQR